MVVQRAVGRRAVVDDAHGRPAGSRADGVVRAALPLVQALPADLPADVGRRIVGRDVVVAERLEILVDDGPALYGVRQAMVARDGVRTEPEARLARHAVGEVEAEDLDEERHLDVGDRMPVLGDAVDHEDAAVRARGRALRRLDADPERLVLSRRDGTRPLLRQQRVGPGRPAAGLVRGLGDLHIAHAEDVDLRAGGHRRAFGVLQAARRQRDGDVLQRVLRADDELDRLGLVRGRLHQQFVDRSRRQRAAARNLPAARRAPHVQLVVLDEPLAVALVEELRCGQGADLAAGHLVDEGRRTDHRHGRSVERGFERVVVDLQRTGLVAAETDEEFPRRQKPGREVRLERVGPRDAREGGPRPAVRGHLDLGRTRGVVAAGHRHAALLPGAGREDVAVDDGLAGAQAPARGVEMGAGGDERTRVVARRRTELRREDVVVPVNLLAGSEDELPRGLVDWTDGRQRHVIEQDLAREHPLPEMEARRAEAGRRAEDVLLAVAVRFRRTEVHVDMVRARHDAARTASAHPDRERVAAIGLEGERVGAPADVRRTVARHPDGGRIAMPALRRPGGPRRLGRRPADGTPAGSRGEVRVGNGDGRDGGEGRRHRGEERSESVHGTDASVSEVEGC